MPIDIHTGANQGIDYLYYFRDRQASAESFLLPVGILLDEYDGDAFDEAFIKPWLALEDCFAQLGRMVQFDVEAWTLELGSAMQIDAESVSKGIQGVKNYLIQKGVLQIPDFSPALPYSPIKLTTRSSLKRYYAPVGGMLKSRIELGCLVQAGQPLYQILSFNKEGQLPTLIEIQAEQGGLVFDISINHALNQGEYVLGILSLD
jgi:uncharacterized protein